MESLKIPQLRDKCIEYGLSKKGNKPELIKRIQEYEKKLQAAMALENQLQGGNIDDQEEESEVEENEDEEVNEDDTQMEKNGVTLLVDAMSYQYLVGAEIDYKDGLEGAQFVIKNPNATTTCGCGSSFSA